jgi:hypothetical protein
MAQKSSALNKPMTFSASTIILFVFIFGLVGGYALFKSLAAKPTSGVILTQTSAASTSSSGTYQVTASSSKMIKNKYYLWGSEVCIDTTGTVLNASDVAVHWPDASNNTGTLSGFSTPPAGSSQCRVFVWLFPDPTTPVSNTVTFNP